ncbi:hypothetical protein C8Q77DRAFT_1150447 [Trametes polyzona]|nr:hypothetical protein C8Q77DRAFT_1150447 [Trametes polyzona]
MKAVHVGRQKLALQHPAANLACRLAFRPRVLLSWQRETPELSTVSDYGAVQCLPWHGE